MTTQRFTSASTLRFRLFQTFTQLFVEIAITAQHFCRVRIAKVRTTLHHFRQGKRLLTGIALHLLRVRVIFF
ncbi:Uncharacterised protein [Shigella sonnei]|nr:Uncharacterised protein [Shigella sonnei]CSP76564.1 Uncharacterised protein [Shigella sonnei]CSR50699.1 Uncharacterised protein [Shigella sonnei]CSS65442.1 Uncharacterised protein [Shigella sonnei]